MDEPWVLYQRRAALRFKLPSNPYYRALFALQEMTPKRWRLS